VSQKSPAAWRAGECCVTPRLITGAGHIPRWRTLAICGVPAICLASRAPTRSVMRKVKHQQTQQTTPGKAPALRAHAGDASQTPRGDERGSHFGFIVFFLVHFVHCSHFSCFCHCNHPLQGYILWGEARCVRIGVAAPCAVHISHSTAHHHHCCFPHCCLASLFLQVSCVLDHTTPSPCRCA
jgi:hypothetical protein